MELFQTEHASLIDPQPQQLELRLPGARGQVMPPTSPPAPPQTPEVDPAHEPVGVPLPEQAPEPQPLEPVSPVAAGSPI